MTTWLFLHRWPYNASVASNSKIHRRNKKHFCENANHGWTHLIHRQYVSWEKKNNKKSTRQHVINFPCQLKRKKKKIYEYEKFLTCHDKIVEIFIVYKSNLIAIMNYKWILYVCIMRSIWIWFRVLASLTQFKFVLVQSRD